MRQQQRGCGRQYGEDDQRRIGRYQEQQRDDQCRAAACAEQVDEVDAVDEVAAATERAPDAERCEQERDEEHQREQCQVQELCRVPDDLQRVKGHSLPHGERQDHRHAEEQRRHRESALQPWLDAPSQQRDRRTAGAVAEQREADDHPREVMPLHDRQQAHQQDLVSDRCGRYEQGRNEQATHVLVLAGQGNETHRRYLPCEDLTGGVFLE